MHILGLSGLAHDTAAALVNGSGVVAAIEESKLVRERATTGIPRAAVQFCLDRAGVRWSDLTWVAVASRPLRAWSRRSRYRLKTFPSAPLASGYYQARALGELSRELNNFRILRQLAAGPSCQVIGFEHQLCHAASAFYASPFDRAAILTLDEQGEGLCGLLAVGEGTRIRALRYIPFPRSPAWVYTQVTDLLGYAPRLGEHKTQWLSLEGEPVFADLFLRMFRPGPFPRIDRSYFSRGVAGRLAFSNKFYRAIGVEKTGAAELPDALKRQVAASIQQACSKIAADLAGWLRTRAGATKLCLAGGLFLNPLIVSDLEQKAGFEGVFAQPAAGNEGTSLGAAWLAWHQVLRQPRTEPLRRLDWGPSFDSAEIKAVLDNCKARYRWCNTEEEKLAETIRLLETGKIVAWFQGAAEFGPRALGHRSLLASPWAPFVKENLNDYVKHRESFRPFAVSVPEEQAGSYFDAYSGGRFLTSVASARPEARRVLGDFFLPGGRIRLHVVQQQTNPLLWRLLNQFGQHAPAAMLVNASFNLFGEPLVVRPRDAVRSFFCSGIDALVIGSFVLTKD